MAFEKGVGVLLYAEMHVPELRSKWLFTCCPVRSPLPRNSNSLVTPYPYH